jgi:hypothetical protein
VSKLRFFLMVFPLMLVPGYALAQITLPSGSGDMGAQINAAQAALPQDGGKILINTQANAQCYSFSVPIVITKAIIIEGQGPSTCLNYTGSGTAVSFYGNTPSSLPGLSYGDGYGLRDLTLDGNGASGSQTALVLGGASDSVGFYASGLTIGNFGLGLQFLHGVWNFKIEHSMFWRNGQSVLWPSGIGYGGENLDFDSVTFVGATFLNSLHFNADIGGGFSNMNSLSFVSCNFDNAQLVIDNGSGSVRLYSPHFENPGGLSGDQPFVRILASTSATDVVMDGPDFYNDQSNPYPPSFIEIDGSPTVTISQMRSVNLDGTSNVPANLVINGDANVTLLGDAPLRATQQQYIVESGNPQLWTMGGWDSSNKIVSQAPLMYSQSFQFRDSTSPVVQIGGDGYLPTIGFSKWSGVGGTFYGMQIQEPGPNELDFCSNGLASLGGGNYYCNAGVVNGVFKSTVPDGTAPLTVTSHTPPDNLNAWPATFAPSGAQIENPHITAGKVVLPESGQTTVAFLSNARFSQPPACTHTSQAPFRVTQQLTSNPGLTEITIYGQQYIGVYFVCIGN